MKGQFTFFQYSQNAGKKVWSCVQRIFDICINGKKFMKEKQLFCTDPRAPFSILKWHFCALLYN